MKAIKNKEIKNNNKKCGNINVIMKFNYWVAYRLNFSTSVNLPWGNMKATLKYYF